VSRVLPAHLVAAALLLGLAASNGVRPPRTASTVLSGVLLAVAAAWSAPRARRLVGIVALAGVAGLAWGGARLDALDRSPMQREIGRAARALAVVTGEPRVGRFGQRLPARLRLFDGRTVGERVQLELPLGRAPP
jgi:hypothetical protein